MKRCFCHLPLRKDAIIVPQFLRAHFRGINDTVSCFAHIRIASLSVVSCHLYGIITQKSYFFASRSPKHAENPYFLVPLHRIRINSVCRQASLNIISVSSASAICCDQQTNQLHLQRIQPKRLMPRRCDQQTNQHHLQLLPLRVPTSICCDQQSNQHHLQQPPVP